MPFFGSRDVRDIRLADVQALYARCVETGRPPSQRSIEMILSTLRRLLADAESQEIIERNVVEAWKRSRGRRRGAGAHHVKPENFLDSKELGRLLTVAAEDHPAYFAFILCLADTGARLGEASALRWIDVDLDAGTARIRRSFSNGQHLRPTKTGRERRVELSTRLRAELQARRPDLFGGEDLVFPNEAGGLIDPHNFRDRVFRRVAERALGKPRWTSENRPLMDVS